MSDAESFSAEQQEYLNGFTAGVAARAAWHPTPSDPGDWQRAAQDRALAAGGRLTAEEEAKRRQHPLDRFDAIAALAAEAKFPRGTDVFLAKFFGLFYVGPAQNAFMCRLRVPAGVLTSAQLRGVAGIADDLAGGYADITTRANLQLREIGPAAPPELLMRLAEIGLTSRGAGADNIRNITASPTAGIDPQELIDTRPPARALHHAILHDRALYGLPRKFNIAFDGGGRVAVLEDTNDIAFTAATVGGAVMYRLGLGGITGHRDFARDTGVVVAPDATTRVARAVVKVFIAEGDRTDRARARLKYLLDRIGVARFLALVEAELGAALTRVSAAAITPAPPADRWAHIGVQPQRQPGRRYIGVVCPGGRLTSAQWRGIAGLADRHGSGGIRLTVWQNFLLPDIAEPDVALVCDGLAALGLAWRASPVRAGLVACTGSAGCKFSAGDTKRHAAALAEYLEARIALDAPVNIHLTGCHHSCAQHFVADIGLLATKVGEDGVEGYAVHVGGGAGPDRAIGRLIHKGVAFEALPPLLLGLLLAWQASGVARFQDWSATLAAA